MEIVKQNCVFSISDTANNGWKVNGTINNHTSGTKNIHVDLTSELGEHIGSWNYNIYNDNISVDYTVKKEYTSEFTTYLDSITEQLLNYKEN